MSVHVGGRGPGHLVRSFASVFNPASLFAGVAGAWYDPSDLSSMFQDSAGTTPAVVGQPVGKMLDKSGNGNHAVQATTSLKPTLQQDASGYYLLFDGVDDWQRATFTIAQPFSRVSAIRQIVWTAGNLVFGGGSVDSGDLLQRTATPQLAIYDGGSIVAANGDAAVGSNAVVSEFHSGASSSLTVNNGTPTTGSPGSTAPGGITLAASFSGTAPSNVRFYGVTMIGRALTGSETAKLRTFTGSKAGLVV